MSTIEASADLSRRPWEDQELSYVTKMGVVTLIVVWLLIIAGAALFAIAALGSPSSGGSSTVTFIVGAVVTVVGIFVFFKWLYPYSKRPTRFFPTNFVYAPDKLGQNFQVRFMGAKGRTLTGKGDARFAEKGFVVNGTLPPPVGVQLLVIVVVTVLPLVIFGIGLGIIPALLIAQYIGKESASIQIPYQSMKFSVTGRTIAIEAPGYQPANMKIRIATPDGERLYRELSQLKLGYSGNWQPFVPPLPESPANPPVA